MGRESFDQTIAPPRRSAKGTAARRLEADRAVHHAGGEHEHAHQREARAPCGRGWALVVEFARRVAVGVARAHRCPRRCRSSAPRSTRPARATRARTRTPTSGARRRTIARRRSPARCGSRCWWRAMRTPSEPDGARRDERRNIVRVEGAGLIVYHGVLRHAARCGKPVADARSQPESTRRCTTNERAEYDVPGWKWRRRRSSARERRSGRLSARRQAAPARSASSSIAIQRPRSPPSYSERGRNSDVRDTIDRCEPSRLLARTL